MPNSSEIIFEVTEDEVDGGYSASALGYGIHTQAETREAVECYFEEAPPLIRLHFVTSAPRSGQFDVLTSHIRLPKQWATPLNLTLRLFSSPVREELLTQVIVRSHCPGFVGKSHPPPPTDILAVNPSPLLPFPHEEPSLLSCPRGCGDPSLSPNVIPNEAKRSRGISLPRPASLALVIPALGSISPQKPTRLPNFFETSPTPETNHLRHELIPSRLSKRVLPRRELPKTNKTVPKPALPTT